MTVAGPKKFQSEELVPLGKNREADSEPPGLLSGSSSVIYFSC
jgi:hypothetical protein